jgi:Protein of unknown function (DUF2845)
MVFAGDCMGPRTRRSRMSPLAGSLLCGLAFGAMPTLYAQVFTVGMKTATADVTTEFHPTRVELPKEPLDEKGRQELIRNLESEQGFAHRELPLGAGLQLIANGTMSPKDEDYKKMLYEKGQSAGAGDRVQVTSLEFRGDRIVIDLNGGPYAKHRFLSHISLNDMPLAQQGPLATGCRVTLIFEGGVPEVTAAEVKALLDPVVDFRAKTSSEAYADTLPPKVREAVEAHEILVGMTRRMVIASMGEPKTKEREHTSNSDADSPVYEEWIYGDPPQATQFVRFKNGKVVRLEIAAIGRPIEVHDKNEMGGEPEPTLQARTIVNGDVQPTEEGDRNGAAAPTLRRPGEVLDTQQSVPGMGKVKMPTDQTPDQQSGQQSGQQTPAQPQQGTAPGQPQPQTAPDAAKTPQLVSSQ